MEHAIDCKRVECVEIYNTSWRSIALIGDDLGVEADDGAVDIEDDAAASDFEVGVSRIFEKTTNLLRECVHAGSFELVARRSGFRLGGRLEAIVAVRTRKHSDKSTYDGNINIHVIESSVVVLHELSVVLACHFLIFDVLYAVLGHVR